MPNFERIYKPKHHEFGQDGFDYVIGTESGSWVAIQVIGADGATFSATTNIGDNLPETVFSEGMILVGDFNQIAVTAGAVLAYRKR